VNDPELLDRFFSGSLLPSDSLPEAKPYWAVAAPGDGAAVSEVTVGEAPPGFETTLELTDPPPSDGPLALSAGVLWPGETTSVEIGALFDPKDVPEDGNVLFRDETVTQQAFRDGVVQEQCP